jgi:hypothetical protein
MLQWKHQSTCSSLSLSFSLSLHRHLQSSHRWFCPLGFGGQFLLQPHDKWGFILGGWNSPRVSC